METGEQRCPLPGCPLSPVTHLLAQDSSHLGSPGGTHSGWGLHLLLWIWRDRGSLASLMVPHLPFTLDLCWPGQGRQDRVLGKNRLELGPGRRGLGRVLGCL